MAVNVVDFHADGFPFVGNGEVARLAEYRIQYKQNGQWLLKYPYTAEGYVFSKTILLDNGTTILNTQWTQKGRLFLYKFLKRKGVLPTIEREDVEN